MHSLKRRLWKLTAAILAATVILLAIGVGLFRAAVPFVPTLGDETERFVEEAIGWPVSIGSMDLRWQWLGPMLVLQDIELLSPGTNETIAGVGRIDLIFRPGDLFQESDFRPSHIRLHQPELSIERDADGNIVLSGHMLQFESDAQLDWRNVMRRVLKHGRFSIVDGTVHYRDRILGIDDWILQQFELTIASDGNEHEFSGSFVPPGPLGEQTAFEVLAEGAADTPENWVWQASVGARQIRFDWVYQQLEWAGQGNFQGTFDIAVVLQGTGVESLQGTGRFAADRLGFIPATPQVGLPGTDTIEHMEFDWIVERDADSLTLDLDDIRINRGDSRWPVTEWHISQRSNTGTSAVKFRAGFLRIQDLTPILEWLPSESMPQDVLDGLYGLQPRGDLSNIEIDVAQDSEGASDWSVAAAVSDLSLLSWRDYPGIEGMDFTVSGTSQQGDVVFDTADALVDLQPLFRNRFDVAQLSGRLSWQHENEQVRLGLDNLLVENADATLTASGHLDIAEDGNIISALSGSVSNADVSAASTYLPVGIMPDELVAWLDRATPVGRIPEAEWRIEGLLEQFPFDNSDGVFYARFPIENLTLDYDPDWPVAENVSADVHFHQGALDVTARSGTTQGLSLAGVHAGSPDLASGRLFVEGSTAGDAEQVFSFLAASPLQEPLSGLLDTIELSGPVQAKVQLDIPLLELDELHATIDAQLDGTTAWIDGLPWPASEMSGKVVVTEQDVTAESLRGIFMGHPLQVAIRSAENGTDTEAGFSPVDVDLSGRSSVRDLADYLPPGWKQHLDGNLDWQGLLRIGHGEQAITLDIESSLAGVTSSLPPPLSTLPAAKAVIRFPQDTANDVKRIDVGFSLDSLLGGRLDFIRSEDANWHVERGVIRSGNDTIPDAPAETGLVLTGLVDVLPVVQWVTLGNEEDDSQAASGKTTDEPLLRAIDITANELHIGHLVFAGQRMSGERLQDRWSFSMQGPIQGAVTLPLEFTTETQARLKLEHLHIIDRALGDVIEPGATAEEEALASAMVLQDAMPAPLIDRAPSPRLLPAIEMDIGNFRLHDLDFGHVTGRMQRTTVGLVTDEIIARDDSFTVTLSGRWEYVGDAHYTSVNAVMDSTDLDAALSQFGYPSGLEADEARITANLSWPASPAAVDIGIIEGRLGFDFQDGKLREISPGAGRIIGLFSLSALPRRLFLDFSDLFGEGLAFDSLQGDYLITNGNAYTTNVQLEGASITGYLVGRTGLAARDYDQVAIVDPGLSASIPLAGYLAAGPTVGAALLVVSQILRMPLSDITQVKYRITGSWDDPVIEEVDSQPRDDAADASRNPG